MAKTRREGAWQHRITGFGKEKEAWCPLARYSTPLTRTHNRQDYSFVTEEPEL